MKKRNIILLSGEKKLIAYDSFTAATETVLTDHVPDLSPLGVAWTAASGIMDIQTNKAAGDTLAGGYSAAVINTQKADVVVTCVVTTGVGGSGPGLIMRWTDVSNYYSCYLNNAGNAVVIIRRSTADGATVVVNTPMTIADSTAYTLKVETRGPNINFYVDGVLKGSYSQNVHTAVTKHGIYADGLAARFDDFKVFA